MTPIYTRTGDDGTTSLVGGRRVPKDDPRIEANGTLDELNALLGVARAQTLPEGADGILVLLQSQLFVLGAELAAPPGGKGRRIGPADTARLEAEIDALDLLLPPLGHFILPGGTPAGSLLHLARAVARRAERQCAPLGRSGAVGPAFLRYLNRLSDLLFVLARSVNLRQSAPETAPAAWPPGE